MNNASAHGPSSSPPHRPIWTRLLAIAAGLGAIAVVLIALLLAYVMIVAKPNLPSIDALTDYRPKMPLRVYTADNVLLGEFGEERRNFMPISQIPDVMKHAVIAIEDDRFYEHGGVDYWGVLRAGVANLRGNLSQGASTITMQVARNFFLSREKTFTRKIYEVLLAWKIEGSLSKDQILELYMNQIYLGQRAYGFSSAAQIYFGKSLKDITIAEAAMLAGLPKAPSAYNPVVNPQRARTRQLYILQRMRDLKYITPQQYEQAVAEKLVIRGLGNEFNVHAEYVAEMVRQSMYEQYKDALYTSGISVYTTITKADQDAAYAALRRGVIDYERRHGYRGPEGFIELPSNADERQQAIDDALTDHPDNDDLRSAVVLAANPKQVSAVLLNGTVVTLSGEGLRFGSAALADNAQPKMKIRPGAIIRVVEASPGSWVLSQLPEVAAAFVSINAQDGAILSLVGGFDFNHAQFNHVTQAWRQPGSSFKPFIYSAALEKGFSPATVVNDAPLSFSAAETGGQAWEPKNYDGKYEGPIPLRRALARSKNMVSIRVLRAIGAPYAQEWITRFGFDADKHPPYLTMALGSGAVTPLQMASAYAVFANGGYRVNPYLIARVVDARGHELSVAKPQLAGDEENRVIDARNAFIVDSLLKEVARTGTAATAHARIPRNDLAGKTGTTNDAMDAWFAGYGGHRVGIAWIGYDTPKSLGDRETGGGLALPVWIGYMSKVLAGEPEVTRAVPAGVVNDGDWVYEEFSGGRGVRSLGLNDGSSGDGEKQKILDLFRR